MMKDYENGEKTGLQTHGMHQNLFIFLPKINEYVIYGDNKRRPHFSPRKVNMRFMETTNKGHLIKNPNK